MFGVHIKEQGRTNKKESEENKISSAVLQHIWIRRGEIPQGAKLLHLGGLVFP
jgi:hypothetical protein